MGTDPVSALLTGIEGAAIPEDIFCQDARLDATVPNWRFRVRGARSVRKSWAGGTPTGDVSRRSDATPLTTASCWSSPSAGKRRGCLTCATKHTWSGCAKVG